MESGKEVEEGSVLVLVTWTSRTKHDCVLVKIETWILDLGSKSWIKTWAGLCFNPRCSSSLLSDFEKNC